MPINNNVPMAKGVEILNSEASTIMPVTFCCPRLSSKLMIIIIAIKIRKV